MITRENPGAAPDSVYTSRAVALLFAVATLITAGVAAYIYAGALICGLVALAGALSVAAWLRTSYRRPGAAAPVVGIYVATIVALIVQHTEEWLRGFPAELTRLFPRAFPPEVAFDERLFISVFPLAVVATLLLAAVALHHGLAIGEYAAWLLFTWAVVQGVAHYVYPLAAGIGPAYVPGMLTAPLPIAVGALGMRRLTALASAEARRWPEGGRGEVWEARP